MKYILIFILLLSFNVHAEYLWKPEAITFEIKRASMSLGSGLMIELNQTLEQGETGWKLSRIDIPESWKGATLEMINGTIFIKVDDGVYYINEYNEGKLSFAILNGGNKTDKELLAIWTEHAKNI